MHDTNGRRPDDSDSPGFAPTPPYRPDPDTPSVALLRGVLEKLDPSQATARAHTELVLWREYEVANRLAGGRRKGADVQRERSAVAKAFASRWDADLRKGNLHLLGRDQHRAGEAAVRAKFIVDQMARETPPILQANGKAYAASTVAKWLPHWD